MVGAEPSGDVAWTRAQIEQARLQREAGRADDAIRILLDAIPRIAGRDDATEGAALANLQLLLLQEGRAIESLVYGRRAVSLLEGGTTQRSYLRARQLMALLHARFDDWERFDAECRAIEEAIEAGPEEEREALAYAQLVMLAGTSLDRCAYDDALGHLEQIERLNPAMATWVCALRAYAFVSTGRAAEARALLPQLRALERAPSWLPIWIETIDARCSVTLEEPATAAERVSLALRRLADPEYGSPGNRASMILQLAESLPTHAPFRAVARKAFHVAAEGNLARILEIERFTRAQTVSVELSADERLMLRDLRSRLHARHAELYAAIADQFEDLTARGDELGGCLPQDDPHIVLCAWCSCVRHEDGRWIPVGGYLPESRKVPLTHGICPACRRDLASVG